MLDSVFDVLGVGGHNYELISVPSARELPITLNMATEFFTFDAVICLGILEDKPFEHTMLHQQELISSLYDYSTYFGVIVGICVLFKEFEETLDIDYISDYAASIANNIVEMIATVNQIHAIEASRNVTSKRHN